MADRFFVFGSLAFGVVFLTPVILPDTNKKAASLTYFFLALCLVQAKSFHSWIGTQAAFCGSPTSHQPST
jgi:hypothetical protein